MKTTLTLIIAALLSLLVLVAPAGAAVPGEVARFELPAGSEPDGIAAGADGNLWFAERGADRIGRITPDGTITEFPLPTPEAEPSQVTAGADGDVWFTELRPGNIGRITPGGEVTEFAVCDYCRPWGVTAGPEGDVWFTLPVAGEVGRITPTGQVTRFPLAVGSNEPTMIAAGDDGNLWIADRGLVKEEPTIGQIVRLTPTGEATRFLVPTPTENFRPIGIAPGPDGALWFAGSGTGVGRIDTTGQVTEFPLPLFGESDSIVSGPDGNIWFGMSGPAAADGAIGRLTIDGHLTTYPIPYGSRGVTVGPDGDIWFTEWAGHGIGRVVPGAPGIEIASPRTVLRSDGKAGITLVCSGGAPGTRCEGGIFISARVRPTSRGHYAPFRRVELVSWTYSIPNGGHHVVKLKLHRRALALLPRRYEVRTEVSASASLGEGARRSIPLDRRRLRLVGLH